MIPFIPLAAALGVVGALARRKKRNKSQTSMIKGDETNPKAKHSHAPLLSVRKYFSHCDERYQTFVQRNFDSLLLGKVYHEQLQSLGDDKDVVVTLSAEEKNANRKLLLGMGMLVVLSLARITSFALASPIILAIGIYTMSPALKEGWRVASKERRFSLIHLMVIYLSALWLGGHYLIGTLGVIFINLIRKVELLLQNATRHNITHLIGEQPQTVWVLIDDCEIEIAFEQVQIGHIMILNAGQSIPIDGIVMQGAAIVDQHLLTGESQPVEKSIGDDVLASTLVLGGRLEVRVEKAGAETTAAKIGDVLNHTIERQESHFSDMYKVAEGTRWPILALGSAGGILFGPTTGLALLGCNYLLSVIPLRLMTLLNGLQTGATNGVLIKDGKALDVLPHVDTIIFDKTGTLTLDQLDVISVDCYGEYNETEVLMYAATAEQRQSHPIAQAILEEANNRKVSLLDMEESHYELGMGLTTTVNNQVVKIGSKRFLNEENISLPTAIAIKEEQVFEKGNALVLIAVDNEVCGAIELAATLRSEAQEVIHWFKQQGLSLYILSGDQEEPTRKIATDLGMDGYFANTLPEQKALRVKELQAEGRKVCFIGDGINDVVALRQAEVSISLKGATTIATDAAQVVLMNNDLSQLKLLWELANGFEDNIKANKRLALQFSMVAAMGVILLPFKFLIVELLWGTQGFTGLNIAHRALLKPAKNDHDHDKDNQQAIEQVNK